MGLGTAKLGSAGLSAGSFCLGAARLRAGGALLLSPERVMHPSRRCVSSQCYPADLLYHICRAGTRRVTYNIIVDFEAWRTGCEVLEFAQQTRSTGHGCRPRRSLTRAIQRSSPNKTSAPAKCSCVLKTLYGTCAVNFNAARGPRPGLTLT